MSTEHYGLIRAENGKLYFFAEYRVIEKGYYAGHFEFKTLSHHEPLTLRAPPEGLLRWPKDADELTKEQKDLLEDTKTANRALKKGRNKNKGGD